MMHALHFAAQHHHHLHHYRSVMDMLRHVWELTQIMHTL